MSDSTKASIVPPWALALTGMFSVQLGSALSIPMINEIGPAGTAWLRMSAGAVILLVIARPNLRLVTKRDLPALLTLGISTGLVTIAFLAAIQRIPLGTTIAIEFLGPLTIATIRSKSRRAVVWPALGFAGVLLMTKPWLGEIDVIGIGFALIAATGWATYIVLTSWLGDRFSGITGLSMTIPIAAITAGLVAAPSTIGLITPTLIFTAIGLAILLPVLPYALELMALRGMSASAFGTLMSIEPAFGTLLGFLILDQHIDASQFIGVGFVVLAGVGSQRAEHITLPNPEIDMV